MTIERIGESVLEGLQTDIVIVGAGPAGLAIASEFLDGSRNVVVLESGGEERSSEFDELNQFVNKGHSRAPSDEMRCRMLGGTSALWTGRCGFLNEIDLEERSWLPHTGWPFDLDTLLPYYQRAGRILGIVGSPVPDQAAQELWQSFDAPAWYGEDFKPMVWQFSTSKSDSVDIVRQFAAEDQASGGNVGALQHSGAPVAVNVAKHLRQPIENSKNVRVFTHSTVSEVEVSAEGQVTGVKVLTPEKKSFSIAARCVVVACGGLENPRLLLDSRSTVPHGLGNDHDQVGRYLTDHPYVLVGTFDGDAGREIRRRMGSRWHPSEDRKFVYSLGLRLSEQAQRREELLNACVSIVEYGKRGNALRSLLDATKSAKQEKSLKSLVEVGKELAHPIDIAQAAYDRFWMRRPPLNNPSETIVSCIFEQELNPDSRITLSEKKNWLGQSIAEIDWRISKREYDTTQFVAKAFYRELDRLGLPSPRQPDWMSSGFDDWKAPLIDQAHPSCTTRMSNDPTSGVVDENCKVHGVDGLYVAGSSVFATNGMINPTQTIVALSIRLADHLKKTRQTARNTTSAQIKEPKTLRVGFVGAGARVANIYAPVMNALNGVAEVVGAVARSPEGATRISDQTGWHSETDLVKFIEQQKPELLIAAVSNNANDKEYSRLLDHGIPLLLETPFCWNEKTGRELQEKITSRRSLVGVAEQFPFFPIAQLRQKIIAGGYLGEVSSVVNDHELYDYHAIAVLRTHIGRYRRPISVNGISPTLPDGSKLIRGTVMTEDNAILAHDYSSSSVEKPFRAHGEVGVFGSIGSILGDEIKLQVEGESPFISHITRLESEGDLLSLEVDLPDKKIEWKNPYFGYHLNDEQIAVAEVVSGMFEAIRSGNSCSPKYTTLSALEDMELMAAMKYSSRLNGSRIRFPFNPTSQKLRVKLSEISRN